MFSLRALSAFGIAMAALGIALGALIVVLRLALGSDWAAEGVFTLFAVLFVVRGRAVRRARASSASTSAASTTRCASGRATSCAARSQSVSEAQPARAAGAR